MQETAIYEEIKYVTQFDPEQLESKARLDAILAQAKNGGKL